MAAPVGLMPSRRIVNGSLGVLDFVRVEVQKQAVAALRTERRLPVAKDVLARQRRVSPHPRYTKPPMIAMPTDSWYSATGSISVSGRPVFGVDRRRVGRDALLSLHVVGALADDPAIVPARRNQVDFLAVVVAGVGEIQLAAIRIRGVAPDRS